MKLFTLEKGTDPIVFRNASPNYRILLEQMRHNEAIPIVKSVERPLLLRWMFQQPALGLSIQLWNKSIAGWCDVTAGRLYCTSETMRKLHLVAFVGWDWTKFFGKLYAAHCKNHNIEPTLLWTKNGKIWQRLFDSELFSCYNSLSNMNVTNSLSCSSITRCSKQTSKCSCFFHDCVHKDKIPSLHRMIDHNIDS